MTGGFFGYSRQLTRLFLVDYEDEFKAAARRWEQIIIGDVQNFPRSSAPPDWFRGFFGPDKGYAGPVDDVVIGYGFYPREAFPSNRTLGSAGQSFVRYFDGQRRTPPFSTVSGVMRFNIDAIGDRNLTRNDMYGIILHEIGHVLVS